MYQGIEIWFTSLGSSLKLLSLHQIFSKFPQEVTSFSANPSIPPYLAVLALICLLSGHRRLDLLLHRPVSDDPKCSPRGDGVHTLTASPTPSSRRPASWLCLCEMSSCRNLISVHQVLVYVDFGKEFYAEAFLRETTLHWICAFL